MQSQRRTTIGIHNRVSRTYVHYISLLSLSSHSIWCILYEHDSSTNEEKCKQNICTAKRTEDGKSTKNKTINIDCWRLVSLQRIVFIVLPFNSISWYFIICLNTHTRADTETHQTALMHIHRKHIRTFGCVRHIY